MIVLIIVQMLFGDVSVSFCHAAEERVKSPSTGNRSSRLTVAVLGFENKTGDSKAEFWRVGIEFLVSSELRDISTIRVAPGVDYARRQINKKEGEGIGPEEARKAGECIEARRVIWGEYRRDGKSWVVTARVMNVATGKVSKDLQAASTDWFTMRDKLTQQIFGELKAKLTFKERRKLGQRWTKIPAALEWYAKARFYYERPNGQKQAEESAQRAVEADPKWGYSYVALAAVLGTAGKLDEAEQAVRKGLELSRRSSSAHAALAQILELKGSRGEAQQELEKAFELDPNDEATLNTLGEIYEMSGDRAKAQEYFLKALEINRYSASAHAHVGCGYALLGKRDEALAELKKAESLASPDGDVGAEQFLYYGYWNLKEIPQTIAHVEKLIRFGKEQGVSPKFLADFEKELPGLKARLIPTYVDAVAPKSYTEESLTEALREKLSPEEMKRVTNPLAVTPEMKTWAQELTSGATNDFEKGRMLLEALSRHAKNGYGGRRTAQEVFSAWPDSRSSFLCEEYTYLYVALAREVGLKCLCAHVFQDCHGRKIQHACAAVFLGEKCLLADPAYYWFGVPHKEYQILNDLEVIAVRLAESDGLLDCEIAYKLEAGSDYIRTWLINALIREQRWDDARKIFTARPWLRAVFRIGIEAEFAQHEGKLGEATEILRKAVEEYPEIGELRVRLGDLYVKEERLAEARIEYRKALADLYSEETVERVYYGLAQVNEKLGESAKPERPKDYVGYRGQGDYDLSEKLYDKAIEDYSEAIRLNPKDARSFYGRAYAHGLKHKFKETIEDCAKVLEIEPRNLDAYKMRASSYWKEGNFGKALGDLEQAIRLAPSDPDLYEMRGDMYERREEFATAAKDYQVVARLRPKDADALRTYAWLLVYSDDKSVQNGVAAMTAAKTACELSSWTNSINMEILAAACAKAGEYDRAIDYEKQAMNVEGVTAEERERMLKELWRLDDYRLYRDSTNRPPMKAESRAPKQ